MEAIIALVILLVGLSVYGEVAEEDTEMEETPVQMQEVILEEQAMEKL